MVADSASELGGGDGSFGFGVGLVLGLGLGASIEALFNTPGSWETFLLLVDIAAGLLCVNVNCFE